MALTSGQLRIIRAEVGTTPDDATLNSLFADLANLTAVSLAVLRPRLADALTERAVALPGVISVGAPPSVTVMAEQIRRLEGQLAAETGEPDTTGMAVSSAIAGRRDRPR